MLSSQLHRRIPVQFGPSPGPRQSFEGATRDGSCTVSVEAYITFRTSQATLTPLLPRHFDFQQPDAEAFVTIAPNELSHLEWLGGHGYRLYCVFIHGVRCTTASGEVYDGTYVPVLWEDFADPIITGREELGYPKVFGDLCIKQTETRYGLEASWKGTTFSRFEISNLEEATLANDYELPSGAHRDPNLLLHRYIPSVGRPGEADADYAVYVPAETENKRQKTKIMRQSRARPSDASLSWLCSEPSRLPTLHHIVGGLAKIPVEEIVACGVVEKKGASDLSSAFRISFDD